MIYNSELPNNQGTDNGDFINLSNMSKNILLMHFNNDSDFGENSTHIYDFSGNGNNGTIVGDVAPDTSNKIFGASSMSFDGAGDYVEGSINDDSFGGENLTISAWAYLNNINPGNNKLIVARQEASAKKNFQVGMQTDNTVLFSTYETCGGSSVGLKSTETLSTGRWYHLAYTLEHNVEKKIYIDGVLATNSTTTSSIPSGCGNQKTSIGANTRNPPTTSWDGLLDEVAIYNRTLSSGEILEHYKRGILELNLSVRSCDDSSCDGENFTDITGDSSLSLSVVDNQYFQYKFLFETDNVTYSPELYNVSIDYNFTEPETPSSGSSGGGGSGSCNFNWSCGEWGECDLIKNIQIRECENLGSCSSTNNPPETERECEILASPPIALFDVSINILEISKELSFGENELFFEVDLLKIYASNETTNASINYLISKENTTIYNETEILNIELGQEFIKTINFPNNLDEGIYTLEVGLTYKNGRFAQSTSQFKVLQRISEDGKSPFNRIYIVTVILLLILSIFLFKILKNIYRKVLNHKSLQKSS